MQRNLVIDFDSTLVKVEALDELARIALSNQSDKDRLVGEIKAITKAGMEGKISFSESLHQRLSLFSPSEEDIKQLIALLLDNISTSVAAERDFIADYRDQI